MITITCDICGKPAMYALDCCCALLVSEKHLTMYDHHICRACASKIGIADYMDARKAKEKAEAEKASKEDNKEEPTE